MGDWVAERIANTGGRFRINMLKVGGTPVDVTWFRDVPTKINTYSSADPFGDGPAELEFPQITAFDDPDDPELQWLADDAQVDIWWVPAMPMPAGWVVTDSGDTAVYENPLTGRRDLIAPGWEYVLDGGTWRRTATSRGVKVYEGFVASQGVSSAQDGDSTKVQCQGALFQADSTLAKPFFPSRPQTVESLILDVFDRQRHPDLRTRYAVQEWPAGWTLVAPAFTGSSNTFDPNVSPGQRWTGYTTRQTGSWDHQLTSYVQGLLANMIVKPGSGSTPGNQWTLLLAHQGNPSYPGGRTPVLKVRDRYRVADFALWTGAPGVELDLTRDSTQTAKIVYGTGTDIAGTQWRSAVVSSDGSRTDYLPLAAAPEVYPIRDNPHLQQGAMARESYIQFGTGFSQLDAIQSSEQTLQRDRDPGWSGTITLSMDPSDTQSRWTIHAGETVLLAGFRGTGARGMRFHIASVECSPESGKATLTVDTRYRDLSTLQDAIDRSRDPLTPAKLLSLNRNSVTIEDIQAPWDYGAGSGYIPRGARTGFAYKPVSDTFPYHEWTLEHPPRTHSQWYVTCHAAAAAGRDKWAGPIPILMSEKGTIRRTEIFMVDINGNLVRQRFHVSLYYNNGIDWSFMPHDAHSYSPFITGAFQSIDPSTGEPWASPGHDPDPSMVIGWGNLEQPAGYSPGLASQGAQPTGLLVDESPWTFDCSANNPNYDHLARAGKEPASVITLYAMFYAEYTSTVFFQGRLYRQEPGTQ